MIWTGKRSHAVAISALTAITNSKVDSGSDAPQGPARGKAPEGPGHKRDSWSTGPRRSDLVEAENGRYISAITHWWASMTPRPTFWNAFLAGLAEPRDAIFRAPALLGLCSGGDCGELIHSNRNFHHQLYRYSGLWRTRRTSHPTSRHRNSQLRSVNPGSDSGRSVAAHIPYNPSDRFTGASGSGTADLLAESVSSTGRHRKIRAGSARFV
jgi:hypothetical protein